MPNGQQLLHIIQGCVKANRASQKELYQNYYGFSMSICMRYCASQDDAVEVVNDGFLKVFKNIASFLCKHNNYEASFMAWVKTIMVHTAIDHFRKNKKRSLDIELDDEHFELNDTEQSSIDRMSYKEIIELVQRLSPVYRAVFNLHVIDGYKHEEIAAQLNIAVGTSKSNLAKARINIQKMLKESNFSIYEQQKAI